MDRIVQRGARRLPLRWVTAVMLAGLVAWDLSGLDLVLASPWAGAEGFVWRDQWLVASVLHEGGRRAAWLLALWLCVGVAWPTGVLRGLAVERRAQLAGTALVAVALVAVLKSYSGTSCPWELKQFGGGVAHHLSHWQAWVSEDGGTGHCFPAGHASSGFAFVGGYFAFRGTDERLARQWLGVAVAAGLLLGLAQQLRGAHFMSHTLWTGWLCWAVAWATDAVWFSRPPALGVAR